jgi:hypothetical protein
MYLITSDCRSCVLLLYSTLLEGSWAGLVVGPNLYLLHCIHVQWRSMINLILGD